MKIILAPRENDLKIKLIPREEILKIVLKQNAPQFEIKTKTEGETILYVGRAIKGSSIEESVWNVWKFDIAIDGTPTTTKYSNVKWSDF